MVDPLLPLRILLSPHLRLCLKKTFQKCTLIQSNMLDLL
nr:MAG TPA: hypothetical protein [Caudoviricetes sp.]